MKPRTARTKGAKTEQLLVDWLIERGWIHAERRHLAGSDDKGDITGIPGMCIEVKSAAEWRPIQWLRELEAETINAKAELGFVAARPKGRPKVDDWVILMTPATLLQLLTDAGWRP